MPARLFTIALLFAPSMAPAQDAHSHSPNMVHDPSPAFVLTEPGQGTFAALSEVVQLLEADPATDWSKVDLDGLRAHLVDMDLLATGAVVEVTALPDGLRAVAIGPLPVLDALRRMVPAHAAQLRSDPSWSIEAEVLSDSVALTARSADPATVSRIKGLGFFGLMASQDHHRRHHLALAQGRTPHGH